MSTAAAAVDAAVTSVADTTAVAAPAVSTGASQPHTARSSNGGSQREEERQAETKEEQEADAQDDVEDADAEAEAQADADAEANPDDSDSVQRAAAEEEEERKQSAADDADDDHPWSHPHFGPTMHPSCQLPSLSPSDPMRYGCEHGVLSGAFLRASCCEEFFVCALCHTEHDFKPSQVIEAVCMSCLDRTGVAVAQPVSASCQNCHTRFAEHYCSICQVFGSARMWHCSGCPTSQFARVVEAERCALGSCVLGQCEESGDPAVLPHPPRASKAGEEAVMQQRMAQRQAQLQDRQKIVAEAEAAAAAAATAFKPAAAASSSASGPPVAPPLNSWPVRASLHAHMLRLHPRSEAQFAPATKGGKAGANSGVVKCADCTEPVPEAQPSARCTEQNCDYALCIACMHQQHSDSGRTQSIQLRRAVAASASGAAALASLPASAASSSSAAVSSSSAAASAAAGEFESHALKLSLILTKPEESATSAAAAAERKDTEATTSAAVGSSESAPPPPPAPICRACDLHLNLAHWERSREEDSHEATERRAFTACKLAMESNENAWRTLCARLDAENHLSPETIEARNKATALVATIPAAYRAALPTSHAENRFSYPAVHEHALSYYEERYGGGFGCNICGESSSGPAFACDPCGWDGHIQCVTKLPGLYLDPTPEESAELARCVQAAKELLAPRHYPAPPASRRFHEHILSFYPSRYRSGTFICNICSNRGEGPVFACNQCSWDCHLSCLLYPETALARMRLDSEYEGDLLDGSDKPKEEADNDDEAAAAGANANANESSQIKRDRELAKDQADEMRYRQREIVERRAETTFTRIEHMEATRLRAAHALVRFAEGAQSVTERSAAFQATKLMFEQTRYPWKCCRIGCDEDTTELKKQPAQLTFHCDSCSSNLCLACSFELMSSNRVRVLDAGLEVDADSVAAWCAGDRDRDDKPIDLKRIDLSLEDGKSALMLALERSDLKQASWLLRSGANPLHEDPDHRNALSYATCAVTSDAMLLQLVQLVLAWRPSLSPLIAKKGMTHDALFEADMQLLNTRFTTPMYLLPVTPLCVAASRGKLDVVELLMSAGADQTGAIYAAAREHHDRVVAILLALKGNCNDTNSDGTATALLAAATRGHQSTVELLLQAGADVRLTNQAGHDVLYEVAVGPIEQPELLARLIRAAEVPPSKSVGQQRATKWLPPFSLQHAKPDQADNFVVTMRAISAGNRYGSHLAVMFPCRPTLYYDFCNTKTYPNQLLLAAVDGALSPVDVMMRELCRAFTASGAIGTKVKTKDEKLARGEKRGSVAASAAAAARSRFQFVRVQEKTIYAIKLHSAVYTYLSYPHIYYASEGGAQSVEMVRFALDCIGCAPYEVIDNRTNGAPADPNAVWDKDDGRYGFTALHAACASEHCSRPLVQLLIERGCSPVNVVLPKRAVKRAAAAAAAGQAGVGNRARLLAEQLNAHTPLYLLMRNPHIKDAALRRDIVGDLAVRVATLHEEGKRAALAAAVKLKPGEKPSVGGKLQMETLYRFAKQLSANPEFVSLAWQHLGAMFEHFAPNTVQSATAQQLFDALMHPSQDEASQRKLLLSSNVPHHTIMNLLPLLASHQKLPLLTMLASNASTEFVHQNSTLDHMSALSVASRAAYAEGVERLLKQTPAPSITNSTDVLGRAVVKIAIESWLGRAEEARAEANVFTNQAIKNLRLLQEKAPTGAQASDPVLKMQYQNAVDAAAQAATLVLESVPVATLDLLKADFDELMRQKNGEKSVDLIFGAATSEWGMRIQWSMKEGAPSPTCWGICNRPLTSYCVPCAWYYCSTCLKYSHAKMKHHELQSVQWLKERWHQRVRALEFALNPPRTAKKSAELAARDANIFAEQQSQRHRVLTLLLSGQGRLDMTDLLAAVRHWSLDVLNFRTQELQLSSEQRHLAALAESSSAAVVESEPAAEEKKQTDEGKEAAVVLQLDHAESAPLLTSDSQLALINVQAAQLEEQAEEAEKEERTFSSTLVADRSLIHLAAAHQDPALIDGALSLLVLPSPTQRLYTAHRPYQHFQLLLFGHYRRTTGSGPAPAMGIELVGLRLFHYDVELTHTATITDAMGRRLSVSSPLRVSISNPAYAMSGQALLYFSMPYPQLLTHYELLIPANTPEHMRPIRWQLCAANDERSPPQPAHRQSNWKLMDRHTVVDAVPAAPLDDASVIPVAAPPVSLCGRVEIVDLSAPEAASSSSSSAQSVPTSFRYYQFLFLQARQDHWDTAFSSLVFRRSKDIPISHRVGIVHKSPQVAGFDALERPDGKTVQWVRMPQDTSRLSVPYSPGESTRAILIYKLNEPMRVNEYDIVSPADLPLIAPAQWRLYATNDQQAAESYVFWPTIDPLRPQEAAWTLIDEQLDVAPPSGPNQSLGPFILTHKNGSVPVATSVGSASARPANQQRGYQYYRLDILRPFAQPDSAAVTLESIRLRDAEGALLFPNYWQNPRGRGPPNHSEWSSVDHLSQHEAETFWQDHALGERGCSELIAVFDKQIDLASYEFARFLTDWDQCSRAREPKSWTVSGSNDKSTWHVLQTVQDAFLDGVFEENADGPVKWSRPVKVKTVHSPTPAAVTLTATPSVEASFTDSSASSFDASAVFTVAARTVPAFLRSISETAHSEEMVWMQRISNDGTHHAHAIVQQPSTVEFSETHVRKQAQKLKQQEEHQQCTELNCMGKEHVTLKSQLQQLSPSLLERIRLLFSPDAAGLTPRDYALTLPVLRVLRRWERLLQLSTVGTDAIVVFHQPKLIDSDVIEQFFRTVVQKSWAVMSCSDASEQEEESAAKTMRKMKQLAWNIESAGLAASVYTTASSLMRSTTSPLHQLARTSDSDATSVLLVTASYSRLLLECSSRALQDDGQYDHHRKLASDLCLPLELQRATCARRLPFTTAQRQALVMRILSGLGTDLSSLATIQHHLHIAQSNVDEADAAADAAAAVEEEEEEEEEDDVADGSGVAYLSKKTVMKRLSTSPYQLLLGEYAGHLRQGTSSYPQRFRFHSITPTADPAISDLEGIVFCDGVGCAKFRGTASSSGELHMKSYEKVKGNILCPCAYDARAMMVEDEQKVDGSWHGVENPSWMGSFHLVLNQLSCVQEKKPDPAAAAAAAKGAAEAASPAPAPAPEEPIKAAPPDHVSVRIAPSADEATGASSAPPASPTDASPHPPPSAAAGKKKSRFGSLLSSMPRFPAASTPALQSTDAVENLVSQTAPLNVLQMVARHEVHALSLLHSQSEKDRLDHAWRHLYVSPEEAEYYAVAKAARMTDDKHPGTKVEDRPPDFPLPSKSRPRIWSPLLQPFTRAALRFSLREGETVITGFHALTLLRSYAGDRVSFFFAFLSYTLLWQFILFIPGLILTVIALIYGADNSALPWNSVFVMIWSTVFIDRWHRKSSELAYTYGTLAYEASEACRPQFRGWRVSFTKKQLADREAAFHRDTKRRVLALVKSRQQSIEAATKRNLELAMSGGAPEGLPPAVAAASKAITRLSNRAFNVSRILLPDWLFSLETWVQESGAGVSTIGCRVFTSKRKKPRSVLSHIARFFTCRCRQRAEEEEVEVHVVQRVNLITEELEDYFPAVVYGAKLALTTLLMILWLAGVIVINLLILWLRDSYYTDPNDQSGFAPYWQSSIGVMLGVTMKILHTLYIVFTEMMLTWENHRTDSAHSNAKIVKTFCFAFINSYFSLFYIALTADAAHAASELAVQLVSVMASRTLTGILFEDVLPFVVFRWMERKLGRAAAEADKREKINAERNKKDTQPDATHKNAKAAVHDSQWGASSMPTMQRPSASASSASVGTAGAAGSSSAGAVSSKVAPAPVVTSSAILSSPLVVRPSHLTPRQAWPDPSPESPTQALPASPSATEETHTTAKKSMPVEPDEHKARGAMPLPIASVAATTSTPAVAPVAAAAVASSAVSNSVPHHLHPSSSPRASSSNPLSYPVLPHACLASVHHDAQLEIQRPAAPSLLDNYLEIITQIGYVTCFSAVFPGAPLLVIGSLTLIGHGLLYKYLSIAQRPIQERAADIGAWVSVLTFLSFISIASNCVLIFHSSGQWRTYFGSATREVSMISAALCLFVFKVLLMAIIPDQAGWVTTKLLAAKYKQDKMQANEISNTQAKDAIKIEREQARRNISKMNAGVQAAKQVAGKQTDVPAATTPTAAATASTTASATSSSSSAAASSSSGKLKHE